MIMMRSRFLSSLLASFVALPMVTGTVYAAGNAEKPKPEELDWTFAGPLGYYDQAQLQRGFQVYREVCAACHGLSLVAFRNLAEPGALGYSEDQVKTLASEYTVVDGPNDVGDMFERPAIPSDRFPSPYENKQQAMAANGGLTLLTSH
jgi:ubiquinol-cytochrome c reductase cytochrome c1 subunit